MHLIGVSALFALIGLWVFSWQMNMREKRINHENSENETK